MIATTIESWLEFLQDGCPERLIEQISRLPDPGRLRVLLIKVFMWLKKEAQAGRSIVKPFPVNPGHQWVKELKSLIELDESVRDILTLSGEFLDLNPMIGDAEKIEILRLVDRQFNPPLMR